MPPGCSFGLKLIGVSPFDCKLLSALFNDRVRLEEVFGSRGNGIAQSAHTQAVPGCSRCGPPGSKAARSLFAGFGHFRQKRPVRDGVHQPELDRRAPFLFQAAETEWVIFAAGTCVSHNQKGDQVSVVLALQTRGSVHFEGDCKKRARHFCRAAGARGVKAKTAEV